MYQKKNKKDGSEKNIDSSFFIAYHKIDNKLSP